MLADINRFADMAVNDEKAVRAIEKRLTETDQSRAKALEKERKKLNKRLAELDRLFSSLYEDKVMGRITERNFEMMSGKYQKEQLETESRLKDVTETLNESYEKSQGIRDFLSLIRNYQGIKELDATIVNALIDKIFVSEREKMADGTVKQKIKICYKFIGFVDELHITPTKRWTALPAKHCTVCGIEYVPGSAISKYCPVCARKVRLERSNESRRRSREQKKMLCIELSAKNDRLGRTEAAHGVCAARQRKQAKLYNTKFALELGREILRAKVKNQEVLLRRYARDKEKDLSEEIKMMKIFYGKIPKSASYTQMMGYEGGAAKYYFQGLAKVIDARFAFSGRSRRPPRDAFNAMLSFGYSILLNEICGVLESKGLNTCFGFIHRDKEGHPTLASDLMEEWRAVLVDAVALSLVNGHEIYPEHFYQEKDTSGYYLTKEGLRIFINKLEKKRRTKMKYLSYTDAPVSFRRAMEMQAGRLVKAIEQEDAGLYLPVHIR